MNLYTIVQSTELLKILGGLLIRNRPVYKLMKYLNTIGVDTNMSIAIGMFAGTGMRDAGPTEIVRKAVATEHDFNRIRIGVLLLAHDLFAQSCDTRSWIDLQVIRNQINCIGGNQWFITLHVYHDSICWPDVYQRNLMKALSS